MFVTYKMRSIHLLILTNIVVFICIMILFLDKGTTYYSSYYNGNAENELLKAKETLRAELNKEKEFKSEGLCKKIPGSTLKPSRIIKKTAVPGGFETEEKEQGTCTYPQEGGACEPGTTINNTAKTCSFIIT
jgi:hypothetical protein